MKLEKARKEKDMQYKIQAESMTSDSRSQDRGFQTLLDRFKMFQVHPQQVKNQDNQGQTLAVWIQCSPKREGAQRLEADLQELQKLGCKAWQTTWS